MQLDFVGKEEIYNNERLKIQFSSEFYYYKYCHLLL